MNKLSIAKEILRTAADLLFADADYVYDPDHRQHPGGGYHKTEKGWSKLDEKEKQAPAAPPAPPEPPKPPHDGNLNTKDYENKSNKTNVSKYIVEKLNSLSSDKLYDIAKDEKAPGALLDVLSNKNDLDIQSYIALNKNTTTKTLDKLSKNSEWGVRWNVSQNKNTTTKTLDRLSNDKYDNVRIGVASHNNTSAKTLDKLSNDVGVYVKKAVANNPNTPTETLDKMAESVDIESDSEFSHPGAGTIISSLLKNKNLSATGVFSIADKYEESCPYAVEIVNHPSMSSKDVEELFDSTTSSDIQVAICSSEKVSDKFLRDKIDNYYGEDDLYGKLCFDTYKEKNPPTTVRYKFKGDDKTAPIIRARFEKGNDDEETDTIYSEMAKFSRDDVAPMGTYHGRSKEQLKADFVKNMNPANYSSPEAFQNAKKRIQSLSAQDFSRMLASIFADEEEEA